MSLLDALSATKLRSPTYFTYTLLCLYVMLFCELAPVWEQGGRTLQTSKHGCKQYSSETEAETMIRGEREIADCPFN